MPRMPESLTRTLGGRLLLGAACVSLLGAGVTPLAHLDPIYAMPITLVITAAMGVGAILVEAQHHPKVSILGTMLFPTPLLMFTMVLPSS